MIQRFIKIPKSQSFFLFGPRGSGKSTWLKDYFSTTEVLWIDLLNQRTEFELTQDPDQLLDQWSALKIRPKWVVIDEVQKIPRILDVVHRGIEDFGILFAMTGSSARKIKRGGANLLGGRAIPRELFPFSALELGSQFDLNKALRFGLLPRLWTDSSLQDSDRVDALYAYVQTYLKEEVAAEQLVRNLEPFRRFLIAAAQSNGKIVNHAAIDRDAGIAPRQAARHFEILADTLIGFYLEPYNNSLRKRQTAHSKFYFFDTGVVRALCNLADEPLTESTYEFGDLFETFLMNEFYKLRAALNLRWNYSYLRTKDNVEIDLIIEKPKGKPLLIEFKSGKTLNQTHVQHLVSISQDMEYSDRLVLANIKKPLIIQGIRCLPWLDGLREIFDIV